MSKCSRFSRCRVCVSVCLGIPITCIAICPRSGIRWYFDRFRRAASVDWQLWTLWEERRVVLLRGVVGVVAVVGIIRAAWTIQFTGLESGMSKVSWIRWVSW